MINFGKYNLIRLYNSLINIQLVMVGKRFSHRRRGGGRGGEILGGWGRHCGGGEGPQRTLWRQGETERE